LKTGRPANPPERGAIRAKCIGRPQLGQRGASVSYSRPDRLDSPDGVNSVASIAHLFFIHRLFIKRSIEIQTGV
jgi:hypothetical protein